MKASDIRVLIACEHTGIVREAFRSRGFDAWSCDILRDETGSAYHLMGDVRKHLTDGWDMMIGHPPCTYLANSGVRWLTEKRERYSQMLRGAEFFLHLMMAPIPHIAIENPIMHKYARAVILREPTQIIQPWQFGHEEQKTTCLWLQRLPKLIPTDIREGRHSQILAESPSGERGLRRSVTYRGIAEAMAEQWGHFILERGAEQ